VASYWPRSARSPRHRRRHRTPRRAERGSPTRPRTGHRRNPAPGHEPTLAGFKQKIAGIKTSFPDLEYDLQDIIASGDTVATR
jgi:hypothetical protein